MRRAVIVAALALVVAGVMWALWPATKWPEAFCGPVNRVVGADAVMISQSFSRPEPTLTTTQRRQVSILLHDVQLAAVAAPTHQLRSELNRYRKDIDGVISTTPVTNAMSQFDLHARTQLRSCAIVPIGS